MVVVVVSTLDAEAVADGVEHLAASLNETCVVAWVGGLTIPL